MKGIVKFNAANGKYELFAAGSNKVLTRSKSLGHINYLVVKGQHKDIVAAGIKSFDIVSRDPAESAGVTVAPVGTAAAPVVEAEPLFSLDEKFDFMGDLINMVIEKKAKSMLITGRGGVGKTFTVMGCLKSAGLTNVADVMPSFADLDRDAIVVEDSEEDMIQKAYAEINRPQGDFVVIKGYSTPKALYRTLFENRKRLVIFDDCDKVLKDQNCVNLLKAALDSYEDRYVSWRTEQAFGESDLPQCFKFEGAILFISNLSMNDVDEAVRTRCFKVDVSMNTAQRIQRMRSVLEHVMPEVDMQYKIDSLRVLEENQHLTDDINFRSLMNVITIRTTDKPNWEKLAKFSLLEQR